jgi:undecaprenyl-diphosphatase
VLTFRRTIAHRNSRHVAMALLIGLILISSLLRNSQVGATVAHPPVMLAPTASPLTGQTDVGGNKDLSAPQAVILGLVEGISEYLPISSTGHLLITEELLKLRNGSQASRDALDSYTVIIQFGAILAVLVMYRKRVITIFQGLLGKSESGRTLLIASIVAFIPAAIIGKGGDKLIKEKLLRPWPVVIAWIVGGIVILVLWPRIKDRNGVALEKITVRHALIIGVAQAVALWPGTSRSFVTILGGLLVGLSLEAAVEFSFLLGLLTLTAATAYESLGHGKEVIDQFGVTTPLIGIVVAGLSAFVAVRFMVTTLNKGGLAVFGYYRVAVGIIVAGLLLTSVI